MHSTKTKFWLAYGLALVWLLTLGRAVADEHLAAPQRVIQETADQLQVSLQKPEYKADFKKATALVDQIIYPHVDFDRVSILVLGKHWRSATPEQRERFKREFRMLLVRTYTTAFTEYANWKIRYLPLDEASDKKALVKTEILQSGGQPVAVNYRMVREGTDWKVYDVLIEKFEEDVAASTQFLANGGAKDFHEYREAVGRIRGLQLAAQTTKDLMRSQMEEDDDE